jgi:predicted DNA-binding protein (MmcQ/YjbR family)
MTQNEFNPFCANLAATTHVVQWGNSDVWKVGGKVFTICGWSNGDIPAITFKTSRSDCEMLREMPGLRPAPHLASRGMTWIQRYDHPGLSNHKLQSYIAESHRIVATGLSRKKRSELGLTGKEEHL